MKKRILGTIGAVLVLALFCSCSGKEIPAAEEEEAERIDCGGMVFTVLQEFDKTSPFGYEPGSTYADMMAEHISSRENALDFSLSFRASGDNAGIAGTIASAVASSSPTYTAAAWNGEQMVSLAFGDCFYPLTELEGILDYTDPKFGGWGMLSLCMAHGIPYGVTPVQWPLMTSNDCFVTTIYNDRYIRDLGLPSPWEFYEQGKWTFDTFSEIIGQYAFTEGDRKISALTMNVWNFALGMWSSNGVHMVGEDADGKLIAGYSTERSVHAMEWAREVLRQNKDEIHLIGDYTGSDYLIAGDTTMLIHDTKNIAKIALKMTDFGVAPFPLGPDIQESERVYLCSFGYSVQILSSAEDPELAGTVLNALCDPFEGFETEEKRIDLLFSTVFFDRNQAEVYANMYKTAEPTYQGVGAHNVWSTIGSQLSSNASVSEILGKKASGMDKYIEDYLGENYQYLKSVGFYH